jgi:hypothetical protein
MTEKFWKLLRICYTKLSGYSLPALICERDAEKASSMIYDLLSRDKPCMIARFGATEITTMVNYLGVKQGKPQNILKYIKGDYLDWWWYPDMMKQMQMWSGLFPPTPPNLSKFCEMMLNDIGEVDILGSWQEKEYYFSEQLKGIQKVAISLLEPWYSMNPWSRILEGKKVLVIHPFAKTIKSQYEKREMLFENKCILPKFQLHIIPAVQSLNGVSDMFTNWFDALEWMKTEIDKHDYDYALIGCGAYGFPLAAYIKRQGKKAIHLGGALQLLFGIWGRRWDDPNIWINEANIPKGFYQSLKTIAWVSPDGEYMPPKPAENGCYW